MLLICLLGSSLHGWQAGLDWRSYGMEMAFFLRDPNHVISCLAHLTSISEWRGKKGKNRRIGKKEGRTTLRRLCSSSELKTESRSSPRIAELLSFPPSYANTKTRSRSSFSCQAKGQAPRSFKGIDRFTLWVSFVVGWQCWQMLYAKDKA